MVEKNIITDLYTRYHRRLRGYILRIVRSGETADDLTHDCFLNMLHYARRHPLDDRNLKSFLFTTAHNLSLNYMKRYSKIENVPLDFLPECQLSVYIDPWMALYEEEHSFTRGLQAMDEVSRTIFHMKYRERLTTGQIAGELGMSERTIRRRVHRMIEFFNPPTRQ